MAIYPAKKGDEDKVAQAVQKLCDEDPTIKFEQNHETHEMLVSGLGEQHLDVVISRLKSKYNVTASLQKPKIAYRETIRKKVSAQGRIKSSRAATDSSVTFGSSLSRTIPIRSNLQSAL